MHGMAHRRTINQQGQLPLWSTLGHGYFFDLQNHEDAPHRFEYETRWSPNIQAVLEIAERFSLSFLLHYEQRGDLLYGAFRYEDGTLREFRLEAADFSAYRYNARSDSYRFESQWYKDVLDIWEILLARKM